MAHEPAHSDELDAAPRAAGASRRLAEPIAVAAAVVFCISAIFPAVAAFVRDTDAWPKWWGVLDVSVAFLLAGLAFAVIGLRQRRVDAAAERATYRAYRVLIHGLFAGLLVFVFFGDRIVWSQCLTGFAWRAWLLCYGLPAWFAALRMR